MKSDETETEILNKENLDFYAGFWVSGERTSHLSSYGVHALPGAHPRLLRRVSTSVARSILDLWSEMYVVPSFRRYPSVRMRFTGSTHTQNFSQGYFPPD